MDIIIILAIIIIIITISILLDIIPITLTILTLIGILVGASFIGAWLWNITLPYIFDLPTVEWWHILALMFLLWIILPGRSSK